MKPLKKLQNKMMQLTHLCQVIIHLSKNNHFTWDVHHFSQTNPQVLMELKRKLNFTEDEINFIEKKTTFQSPESD